MVGLWGLEQERVLVRRLETSGIKSLAAHWGVEGRVRNAVSVVL